MTTTATDIIHCHAPAKINLSLAVQGRRSDGFHEIESWVVQLDWCDRLTLTPADDLSVEVCGRSAGVPTDSTNLVWRAAEALAAAAGLPPTVGIRLEKEIPVGAGLGGGSSDAAAVLFGLNIMWDLDWPIEQLLPIAAELGSDVPLFLSPEAAIIRGRGEKVERCTDSRQRDVHGWFVLLIPPYEVATRAVYQAWSDQNPPAASRRTPWLESPPDSMSLMLRLFNDLEPAAFVVEPRLQRLHAKVDGLEGRPVRMSGSGGALFTLFDEQNEAEAWANAARDRLDNDMKIRVTSTV